MKTFQELEKQFLNDHHERYAAFTKLLVMLSVAFITLLASSGNAPDSILFKAAIICQLMSLGSGLFVQHQIMVEPLYHLRHASDIQANWSQKDNLDAGNQDSTKIRRKPTTSNQCAYTLQLCLFVLSFLFLSSHLVT